MDYAGHYSRLIERARNRTLSAYRERHHVVPRCMGGGDAHGNIVELTAEEHYVAHQLLVKIHPSVRGLTFATVRMARKATGNKAYGWLRRRHAVAAHELHAGKPKSAAHKAKIGMARRGQKLGPRSPEVIAKSADARRGKKLSAEHRAKLSTALLGNKRSAGKPLSPERRAKLSAAKRGRKLGPQSAEHRAKLSAALQGKKKPPRSAEHRAQIAIHKRAYWNAKRYVKALTAAQAKAAA